MSKLLKVVRRRYISIFSTFLSLTLVFVLVFILIDNKTKASAISTISGEEFYTSKLDKATININSPSDGDKLALYTKSGNKYVYSGKEYGIKAGANYVAIDIDLSLDKTQLLNMAIIPSGKEIEDLSGLTSEQLEKKGITMETVKVSYDNIPPDKPAITKSNNSSDWINSSINIKISGQDNAGGSGIYKYQWKTNEPKSDWQDYDDKNSPKVSKNIIFYARAIDKAGLYTDNSIEVKNIDLDKPIISEDTITKDDISWNSKWIKKGESFTVKFKVNDAISGLKSDSIKVNAGGVILNATAPLKADDYYTAKFTVGTDKGQVNLDEGDQIKYSISASDLAGNLTYKEDTSDFKCDITAPKIVSSQLTTYDSTGAVRSKTKNISNNDVIKVSLKLDEKGVGLFGESIKATVNGVTKTAVASGNYYEASFIVGKDLILSKESPALAYNAQCEDLAGNQAITDIQNTSIIFDNEAPVFSDLSIVKDDKSKTDSWIKDEEAFTVQFKLQDVSGIDDNSITVVCGDVITVATPVDGGAKGYYSAKFTVGNDKNKVKVDQGNSFKIDISYKDNLGNEGKQSQATSFKYDSTNPICSDVTVEKGNKSKTTDWVTNGDTFTVKFKVDDGIGSGVDTSSLKVNCNGVEAIATPSKEKEGYYFASFTVGKGQGQVATDEDKTFSYNISFSDVVGNSSTYKETTGFKYNYSPPSFSDLSIIKDDLSRTGDWIKNGDTFTVKFKLDDNGLSPIDSNNVKITIGKVQLNAKQLEGKDIGYYTASFTVGSEDNQVSVDENDKFSYLITYNDIVGNSDKKEGESSFRYDNSSPVCNDFSISKEDAGKTDSWVKNGDKIKVRFKLDDKGLSGVKDDSVKVTVNGVEKIAEPSKDEDKGYYYSEFVVGNDKDNITAKEDSAFQYQVSYSDVVGNSTSNTGETSFRYDTTAPKLTDMSITKDDTSKTTSWVKNNDTFTVKFKLDDNKLSGVDNDSVKVTFSGISKKADPLTGQDLGYYTAQFTVGKDAGDVSAEDNNTFAYKIEYSDIVGNSADDSGLSPFKYDEIAPKYNNLTVNKTSGATMDKPSLNVVRNGDKVRVNFKLDDFGGSGINDSTVKIKLVNNDEVLAKKDDSGYFYEFQVGKDYLGKENDTIKIEYIRFSDIVGNETTCSISNEPSFTSQISYYAPINDGFTLTQFSSNNENKNIKQPTLAKVGNTLTLSFKTTHPVIITDMLFEGKAAKSINSQDGMNWIAVYDVGGFSKDRSNISFTFTITDLAGNDKVAKTEVDAPNSIEYYAPIVVTDLKIITDNKNDGTKYAKDGDNISITFKTNHETTVSNTKVVNKVIGSENIKASKDKDIAEAWLINYNIKNGDINDLEDLSFSFDVDDKAGNTTVSKKSTDTDVANQIKYFKPITAVTSIKSDEAETTYAKNGTEVVADIQANHNVKASSANIFSRPGEVLGNDSMKLSVQYKIPENEGSLPEGNVPLSVAITDLAGNDLNINETNDPAKTKVIYDRTKPELFVKPNFSGFTNKGVQYDFVYNDKNLSASGVSLDINGSEQINDEDRKAISGAQSYTKSIKLDKEGEYDIKPEAMDLAENKYEDNSNINIVIDKTNPKVTTTKINQKKPMTFKKGLILSKLFNIEEEYVQDIICRVTDKNGSQDWDVDDPIETEGRKTIYLLVTDKAGNSSQALTYDIYIDGTAPKVKVEEDNSKRLLGIGSNEPIISKAQLNISLEKLEIGNEEPDKFTKLQLVDSNGNVVKDLLKYGAQSNGVYTLDVKDYGDYKLIAEATDNALSYKDNDNGNKTGTLKYNFTIKEKSIVSKYYDNKTLIYSSISGAGILLIVSIIFLYIRYSKKAVNSKKAEM
jgi:hypothetical protein